jgi:DNA-binding response OmpR family regulator
VGTKETNRSVLIVEDDPDLSEVHRRAVLHLGLEPTVADTCALALGLAVSREFVVIMMDLKLPDGSGLELCEKIWDRRPEQAILVISGSAFEDDPRLHRATGILLKPFRMELLFETINRIIGRIKSNKPLTSLGFINPICK